MLGQLLVSGLLLAVRVAIHAFGTLAIGAQVHGRVVAPRRISVPYRFLLLVELFPFIFALHAIEMLLWAWAFWHLGALADIGEAVYFSLSSYTTVGYGDVVLGPDWRIFGAAQAAAGILLFGWSTALLFSVIQPMYARRDRAE